MPNTTHKIDTAGELVALIPKDWEKALVGIANRVGGAEPIGRVSFHENADGRRIILFHADQIAL